jgi:hypothetical protein
MTVSELKVLVDKYAELNPNAEVLIEYTKTFNPKIDKKSGKLKPQKTLIKVRTINDIVINGTNPILIKNKSVVDIHDEVRLQLFNYRYGYKKNYFVYPDFKQVAEKQKELEKEILESKNFVQEYLVIQ